MTAITIKTNGQELIFYRVNSDINGNPRYVIHFLSVPLSAEEKELPVLDKYETAVNKCKSFGGKKYRGKEFGGGIVFQSYNLEYEAERILKL